MANVLKRLSGAVVFACVTALLVFIILLLFAKKGPALSELTIEAGSQTVITVNNFKANPEAELEMLTDSASIDLSKTGDYTVSFLSNGKNYESTLHIVDTTPPAATAVDKQIFKGDTLSAEDFVTDIKDCSGVEASFEEAPDFTAAGEQTVNIILTDAFSNQATVSAQLTVVEDTEPPVFEGLTDITVQTGNSVSYRNKVTVTDNRDSEITFSFDSSGVDLTKEGEYKVIYTAADSSGNTATAERTVKVTAKPVINEEYVKGLAKKVIDKIITADMTAHQKIDKIFRWMRSNISYVSSPEIDIVNAAYVGFTKKRGDCMNYYSMTKILLDVCGIENMMIERYGGKTTHYWHLVNIGTGWYHYDTTPQSLEDPYRCFMKTDAEVFAYAASRHDGRSDYYNFDATKYPERATKKYSAN